MAQDEKQEAKAKSGGLNISLAPVDHSDQPTLSNYTRIHGAPGIVYVDFGFLDPTAMDALSRIRQTGGKIPDRVNGKLAVRVAMGFDTLATLHQQLGSAVAGLRASALAKSTPPQVDEKAAKKNGK
jgi:hypothetical protein